MESWLPIGEHLSPGAQGRQMEGALGHVALRSHPSSWGHLEMEAVSKASEGRARCAATGRGTRSPRVGSDGRNVLATDHPGPLWGSWCPVETHAAWPSIHSEKTCGQDGQISNGTNDSFQAKSNKLSMVWDISLFKKINAGIFKSKNENRSQWVFNLCSIHRKKRSSLSETAFYVKRGRQTHGSLAGPLPFCIHGRCGLWITVLFCLPLSPSQYSALGNHGQSTGASLQNETYFAL